ncbi:MAG: ETC complex I subunit [Geminicoccaceae bacterium]|nr:MAG: ETC complex I subunit [Geminicoccaceae bacterium]
MAARIYRPAKPAVSSGKAKSRVWLLEMEPCERREADSLMGWVGSGDTTAQVTMRFPTKEAAIAFAKREGIEYTVEDPHERLIKPKSYSDNFIRRV